MAKSREKAINNTQNLIVAFKKNDQKMIIECMNVQYDLTYVNDGESLLSSCIANCIENNQPQNLENLSSLLDKVDKKHKLSVFNQFDGKGYAPIHTAIIKGRLDILKLLIEKGADINAVSQDKFSGLMFAIAFNKLEIIDYLLNETETKQKIKLNLENTQKTTVLNTIFEKGKLEVISLFLKNNINLWDEVIFDKDAKHNKIIPGLNLVAWIIKHNKYEILKLVLSFENIKDIIIKKINNDDLLHHAVRSNYIEIVNLLINSKDLNVNKKDLQFKRTPLIEAIGNGHEEIAALLLKVGNININIKDSQGFTALLMALSTKYHNISSLILENFKEVDVTVKNIEGFNTLMLACLNKHENAVELLLLKEEIDINYTATTNNKLKVTALWFAIQSKNENTVSLLMKQPNINLNFMNSEGLTYLHFAVEKNLLSVVKLLLEAGIDPSIKSKTGFTALGTSKYLKHNSCYKVILRFLNADDEKLIHEFFSCASKGDFKKIELIIKKYTIDVNHKYIDGYTALHLASNKGHLEVVRVLINTIGISINMQASKGVTALHLAAQSGHLDIVKLLIDAKSIDINSRTLEGETALFLAVRNGHTDVVKLLIHKDDIDFESQNLEKFTLLHLAVRNGHIDIVKLLTDKESTDLNAQTLKGFTALHLTVQNGRIDIAKLLVDKESIDLNVQTIKGNSALHLAVQSGNTDIVKLLTDKESTDPNAQTLKGFTALHLAVRNGHIDIVKLLTDKESTDLNAQTLKGFTALHLTVQNGRIDIAKLLVDKESIDLNVQTIKGNSALHLAVQNGNTDIVKLLTNGESIDLNVQSVGGVTALHLAVENNHIDIVKLLTNGESIDLNVQDSEGFTALILAAKMGYTNIVELLINKKDIELDIQILDGATALFLAAQNGHLEVVKLLINKKVILDMPALAGATAFFMAVQKGHTEIVKLLIDEKNINFFVRVLDVWTPLLMAAQEGYLDIIELFLQSEDIIGKIEIRDINDALVTACRNDHIEIIKLLLAHGADSDLKFNGKSLLELVSYLGNEKVINIIGNASSNLGETNKLTQLEYDIEFENQNLSEKEKDNSVQSTNNKDTVAQYTNKFDEKSGSLQVNILKLEPDSSYEGNLNSSDTTLNYKSDSETEGVNADDKTTIKQIWHQFDKKYRDFKRSLSQEKEFDTVQFLIDGHLYSTLEGNIYYIGEQKGSSVYATISKKMYSKLNPSLIDQYTYVLENKGLIRKDSNAIGSKVDKYGFAVKINAQSRLTTKVKFFDGKNALYILNKNFDNHTDYEKKFYDGLEKVVVLKCNKNSKMNQLTSESLLLELEQNLTDVYSEKNNDMENQVFSGTNILTEEDSFSELIGNS